LRSGTPFVADTSTVLKRTIAGVLDIRGVFPRVSEVGSKPRRRTPSPRNSRIEVAKLTLEVT